jgi:phage host-nuclease inhibitor protein Gam
MNTEIKIDLTPEELQVRGKQLAQLIREKSLAEQARADAAKEAAEQIKEMDTEIHRLAKEIREKCRFEPSQQELIGVPDGHRVPFQKVRD